MFRVISILIITFCVAKVASTCAEQATCLDCLMTSKAHKQCEWCPVRFLKNGFEFLCFSFLLLSRRFSGFSMIAARLRILLACAVNQDPLVRLIHMLAKVDSFLLLYKIGGLKLTCVNNSSCSQLLVVERVAA